MFIENKQEPKITFQNYLSQLVIPFWLSIICVCIKVVVFRDKAII